MPGLPPPLKTKTPIWLRLVIVGLLSLPVLFVLIVLLVVGWRWHLKRDVDGQMAALHAQGVPLNGEELNGFYPTVPDRSNAALVLTQAFALLAEYPDDRAGELKRFRAPRQVSMLSEEERTLLEGHVEMNRDALDRLRKGLALSECRYPVDFTALYETELPHLSKLKQLALLLSYDALLNAQSGNTEDAANTSAEIFVLARTLDKEPVLISALVRMAILNIAEHSVEMTLAGGQLDQAHLDALLAEVRQSQNTNVITRALMGEIGMCVQAFRMSAAELDRVNQSNASGGVAPGKPIGGPPHPVLQITGFMERDLRFFLDSMNTLIALSRSQAPGNLEAMKKEQEHYEMAGRRLYILSAMLLPSYSNVLSREARLQAILRLAESAIAIEMFRLEHHRLPAELEELTPAFINAVPNDPFDGQPLRYRKLDRGYILYSVGRDGFDDGGREPPPRLKSSDTNTYDLTFIVER